MSSTPKRVVTEAHRATAIAALEEAGIAVESVADEFNTNTEHWNLGHCRKALRKAGLSVAEVEEVLAEADTAPTPPAPDAGPAEKAAALHDADATADTAAGDTPPEEITDADASGDEASVILRSRPDLKWQGEESVTVTQPLTEAEKLEYANDMARALREKRDLEASLKAEQDHYKPLIKAADAAADKAARAFEEGKEEREIFCDKLFDFDSSEVVWADAFSGEIVQRRRMTHEEKQLPLPMSARGGTPPSDDAETVQEPELLPEMPPAAHSGPAVRECYTCTNNTTRVELYPCAGCSRNPETAHAGEEDRWDGGASESAEVPLDADDGSVMPTAESDADAAEADGEDASEEMPILPPPLEEDARGFAQ